MAVQKEFLAKLRTNFRLNTYEVKIWTALLSKGVSSAGELADISGVPRSRCYDILESLEKKGFVLMKLGKPIEYMAFKPEIIMERVNNNIKEDANKSVDYMNSLKETDDFKELDLLYKTGIKHVDVSNMSKSIVGTSNINKQIKDMIASAKSGLTIVTTLEGLQRRSKFLRNTINNLNKKGVSIRLFAPYDKSLLKKINNIKFMDYQSSTQFINRDNEEILFMITPDSVVPEYEVGIWVKSNFFVNAVNILFEQSIK